MNRKYSTWYVFKGKVYEDVFGMIGYKYKSTAKLELKILRGEI